jgi:hypothetical protein
MYNWGFSSLSLGWSLPGQAGWLVVAGSGKRAGGQDWNRTVKFLVFWVRDFEGQRVVCGEKGGLPFERGGQERGEGPCSETCGNLRHSKLVQKGSARPSLFSALLNVRFKNLNYAIDVKHC